MDIVERARIFATESHAGQKRKYTGEDYIVHPAEVVETLRAIPHTPEMLAAGWLHDVAEDCGVGIADIGSRFGRTVQGYVFWLTDPELSGNRATRKAYLRERWRMAPPEAMTIKLADVISNTRDVAKHDPKFFKVYGPEVRLLLPCLQHGDKTLFRVAECHIKVEMRDAGI